jgi:hypothetical protein
MTGKPKVGDWILTTRPSFYGTLTKLWHVTAVGRRGGLTGYREYRGTLGRCEPEWMPDAKTAFHPETDRIISRREAEAYSPELMRQWDAIVKPRV